MSSGTKKPPKRATLTTQFPLKLEHLGAQPIKRPANLLRPQRTLAEAARYQQQHQELTPDMGFHSIEIRKRMVDRLSQTGIKDERILTAMLHVERHHFVDTALRSQAYEDTSLPIGMEQTISKPSSIARMLNLLCMRPQESSLVAPQLTHAPLGTVLEIGTGCGYQAALLGRLAQSVVSIERINALHHKARQNLSPLNLSHISLIHGDGTAGYAPHAPYHSIIAAASGTAIPEPWLAQLAIGGRLVAPVSDTAGAQYLLIVDRLANGQLAYSQQETVCFVPLKSGTL